MLLNVPWEHHLTELCFCIEEKINKYVCSS